MRMLLLIAALLGLVALAAPIAAQPAGDPVPKILEAWKKRQTAFKTVKYVVTGKVEHLFVPSPRPGAEKVQRVQPKLPLELPFRAAVLIDCEKQRFRLELDEFIWSARQQTLVATDSTRSFDGSKMFAAVRNGKEQLGAVPDVAIVKGDLAGQQVGAELWPLFAAHGIIPTARQPLRPDKPPTAFTPEMFHRRGQLSHEGIKCEVLNSEPLDSAPAATDEFWIDAGSDGFIRRHTYYAGRNPFIRLDAKSRLMSGAHVPAEWTCTWTEGNRTRAIHRLKVETFEGNPAVADTDFSVVLKAGAKVEEHDIPQPGSGLDPIKHGVKTYTIDASGTAGTTTETPQRRLDGSEVPLAGNWRWVLSMTALAFLAVVGVFYFRSKRTR